MRYIAAISLVVLVGTACPAEEWSVKAEPWPEADELFRRDSRWRGADAANSIDLGGGRVLWTFGDSFVSLDADPERRQRKTARFIRNSIALQVGYDPTCADFHPYWQEVSGQPAAFLRPEGDVLFWPGGGLVVDEKLLVFLMRIRNAKTAMGFDVAGWGAVLIENPNDDPPNWRMKFISTPQNSWGVLVGSGSIVRQGDWVYAYSAEAYQSHKIFLVRFDAAAAATGNLASPQWWNGQSVGWVPQSQLQDAVPQPVATRGQTEFTVHHEPRLDRYLLTQFQGFPQTPIALRVSKALTGPWSPLRAAYDPPELAEADKDLMLYAAKAHPEQKCTGLAVTYCSNTWNLARVRDDETVYYPRFARLILNREHSFNAQPEESADERPSRDEHGRGQHFP
jgi:hypothetical protein